MFCILTGPIILVPGPIIPPGPPCLMTAPWICPRWRTIGPFICPVLMMVCCPIIGRTFCIPPGVCIIPPPPDETMVPPIDDIGAMVIWLGWPMEPCGIDDIGMEEFMLVMFISPEETGPPIIAPLGLFNKFMFCPPIGPLPIWPMGPRPIGIMPPICETGTPPGPGPPSILPFCMEEPLLGADPESKPLSNSSGKSLFNSAKMSKQKN